MHYLIILITGFVKFLRKVKVSTHRIDVVVLQSV